MNDALPPTPPLPPTGSLYGGYGFRQQHNGALASLILAAISVTSCCFPLGFVGFYLGRKAKAEIAAAPEAWSGEGMATAGWVIGLVSGVLGTVVVVGYIGLFVVLAATGNLD